MGAGHDHGQNHDHSHQHGHAHHHGHGHNHHHHGELPGDAAGLRRLTIAFALNLAFTIAEVIGGLWTNSMAILADALHDLGDSLALGLALAMQSLSRKGRDGSFSYGYRRFSLLAALVNSVVLSVGAVFIFFEAIPRVLAPEPVYVPGMIGFAIAGILFNGFAAWQMHGGESLNEKMVRWHLLEDVLGWIAVLISALAMLIWDLPVLDAVLSIGINLFILYNVSRVLWQTLRVFLQSVPTSVSVDSLEAKIEAIPGVQEIHDTHLWSLDGSYHVLTLHVVIAQDSDIGTAHEIKCAARAIAKAGGIAHATIEVEREQDECALTGC